MREMNNALFWHLYSNGKINVKIYSGIIDDTEVFIEAFEYENKFYLRIHKIYRYTTGRRSNGKKYNMTNESHFIKEFDDRNHANNYFKKIAKGIKRVD